ncbi:MAG: FkbM family methyltransferase [Cyanobacteriota bacterium]|nr:FkbM family methyltransferase [Cyanobacteriota bacterium]
MNIKNWLKTKLRNALGISNLFEKIHQIQGLLNQDKQLDFKPYFQTLIERSKSGTIFTSTINNMELLVPVETVRLFPHCLHLDEQQYPIYWVETRQSDWLCEKLNPGDTALDIGAAFGIITAALSKTVGETGIVHAFDPSKTAQQMLRQLIELNNLQNVTVIPKAISECADVQEFIEYTADNDLSWASDSSTLAAPTINSLLNHVKYSVEVTTLDDYVAATGIKPKAIKMDIEGFELYALQGAKATLEKFSPYLCIDIHKDVKTGESALVGVEPYLQKLGYSLKMEGHALYCTPGNG